MDFNKQRAVWWTGVVYHLEQLNALIENPDIKTYAYILHDKDILPETGELKKPHYHFLVQLHSTQRGSWFKQFATDDMGQIFPQATYSPQGAYDYLIHDTPKAKKDGKYLYPEDERISTIETLENTEKEKPSDAILADLFRIADEEITWTEFFKQHSEAIYSFSSLFSAVKQLIADKNKIKIDPFEKTLFLKNKAKYDGQEINFE